MTKHAGDIEQTTSGRADFDRQKRCGLAEKVKIGKWTPERAEAVAKRLGVGPLAGPRDPERFNPLKGPRWTLPMAVAWITWRDIDIVREQMREYRAECTEWRQYGPGFVLDPVEPVASVVSLSLSQDFERDRKLSATCISVYQARDELLQRLLEGRLAAEGVCQREHKRIEIPSREWQDLRLGDEAKRPNSVRFRDGGYDDVLVRRDDVLNLWPKQSTVDQEQNIDSNVHDHQGEIVQASAGTSKRKSTSRRRARRDHQVGDERFQRGIRSLQVLLKSIKNEEIPTSALGLARLVLMKDPSLADIFGRNPESLRKLFTGRHDRANRLAKADRINLTFLSEFGFNVG